MANEKVVLPLDTLNKVLQFVAAQPYSQVAELVKELQENAQVVEGDDDAVEESSDAK